MNNLWRGAIGVAVLLASPHKAFAQTATCIKEPGQLVLFPAVSYYRTSEYFDDKGASRQYQDNGVFTRAQTSLYVEYGLTRKIGLLANAGFARLRATSNQGRRENVAFGNPEIGAQLDITHAPLLSRFFCAFGVVVKLPYRSAGDPLIGYDQTDVEARLRAVGWVQFFGHPGYWVVDLAGRHRFGPPGDGIRVDATTAVNMTRQLAVLLQLYTVTALHNSAPPGVSSNPNVYPDYSAYSPQLGLLYEMIPGLRLQMSWSPELAGRNAGHGQTFSLVWWIGT